MSMPVPKTTEEPLAYRPLSNLAVAGFAVSALYGLVLSYAGLRSLGRGEPLLLPGWTLLLPIAGGVLSLLGQVHIRGSEGTRAGMKLTRWGLGLALCFGLGYFVYSLGTGMAVRGQATRFLTEEGDESGFLLHLQNSGPANRDLANKELQKAFRLSLRPSERPDGRVDLPADFFLHPLVLFFATGSEKELKVEPRGVIDWSYTEAGFVVRRLFRLTNEEAEVNAEITVKSVEGREGEPRRWFVSLKNDETFLHSNEPRPTGTIMDRLRHQASDAVNNLGKEDATSFQKLDQTDWDRIVTDLDRGTAFREIEQDFDRARELGAGALRFQLEGGKATWARDQGRLKILFPFKQKMAVKVKGTPTMFNLFGQFEVASREMVGPITNDLKLSWQLTGVRYFYVMSEKELGPPK